MHTSNRQALGCTANENPYIIDIVSVIPHALCTSIARDNRFTIEEKQEAYGNIPVVISTKMFNHLIKTKNIHVMDIYKAGYIVPMVGWLTSARACIEDLNQNKLPRKMYNKCMYRPFTSEMVHLKEINKTIQLVADCNK